MNRVANVNLPRPVVALGGVICLAVGYLLGVVVTADDPEVRTAEVVSFDRSGSTLCLGGDAVADSELAEDGEVCGRWMRPPTAEDPPTGAAFEFVLHSTAGDPADADGSANVLIYGDVVD